MRKNENEIAKNLAERGIDYERIKKITKGKIEENRVIFADLIWSKKNPFSAKEITEELDDLVGDVIIDPSQTTYGFLEYLFERGYFRLENNKYIPKTINELIDENY